MWHWSLTKDLWIENREKIGNTYILKHHLPCIVPYNAPWRAINDHPSVGVWHWKSLGITRNRNIRQTSVKQLIGLLLKSTTSNSHVMIKTHKSRMRPHGRSQSTTISNRCMLKHRFVDFETNHCPLTSAHRKFLKLLWYLFVTSCSWQRFSWTCWRIRYTKRYIHGCSASIYVIFIIIISHYMSHSMIKNVCSCVVPFKGTYDCTLASSMQSPTACADQCTTQRASDLYKITGTYS